MNEAEIAPVVRSTSGVTLIGGGAVSAAHLDQALALAPLLVAADSGGDAALALGHRPERVIGDLDSLSPEGRAAIGEDRVLHIAEQDSTDFTKCLTRIAAPFVIAVGFDGRRVDHTLAALTVLIRRPGPPCLMLTAEDAIIAAPARVTLDLEPGTRVSLFPMGVVRGRSTGLRWPIDGLTLSPAGQVGTSNEATGPVTIDSEGPLLLILPATCLKGLLSALLNQPHKV